MSRLRDELYFAPEIRFRDLDLDGGRLPTQFRARINGYYLKPALALAKKSQYFASGLLAVCAFDAVSHLITGSSGTTARIVALSRRIPELSTPELAAKFCEDFRNGLVHEARLKNGGEFDGTIPGVARYQARRLIVNPAGLAAFVEEQLETFVTSLHSNLSSQRAFSRKLQNRFRFELEQ